MVRYRSRRSAFRAASSLRAEPQDLDSLIEATVMRLAASGRLDTVMERRPRRRDIVDNIDAPYDGVD